MLKRVAKIVISVVATLATIAVGAGSASASSGTYFYYSGAYRSYGEFQSYGDHWYACDIYTDGWGTRVTWSVPSTGRTGSVSDTSGNDGVCAHQNVDIGEGRTVQYRVCAINNGSIVACSAQVSDVA
jgi:hypothetical protein